MARFAVLVSLALLVTSSTFAQNSDPAAGIHSFATLVGGPVDSVDLATSNVLLSFPVRAKAGKSPFSYRLAENSHFIKNGTTWSLRWGPPFRLHAPVVAGQASAANLGTQVSYLTQNYTSYPGHPTDTKLYNWIIADPGGVVHAVPGAIDTFGCIASTLTATASDGSDYTLVVSSQNPSTYVVYDRSGNRLTGSSTAASSTDPDGVVVLYATIGTSTTYSDSLLQTAISTVTG